MKCLLCNFQNNNDEELKTHYKAYHLVKTIAFLKNLFASDVENKYFRNCDKCKINVKAAGKNESLLFSAL